MDDRAFGTRNKRGDYFPSKPLETGPLLAWPPRPRAVLRWLPGYFLPWNVLFMALAAVWWLWLTPPQEVLKTLHWSWAALVVARNAAIIVLVYGLLELRLYIRRAQGNRFKYNAKFPSDTPSDVFMFRSQVKDSLVRTFLSGIPIWSAYEIGLLWAWANGWGPWTTFAAHPWWLVIFGLCLPLFHDLHFYLIHRLIHTPFLYRWVHSVHHNSVNPSPWSSLSMHPVEHLLYWSGSLIHLVLPSHPLLAQYHLLSAGVGAVVGHVGFDKMEVTPAAAVPSHAYAHYLHHKHFEVNYADGALPLDRWFGTWHDGTSAGEARMNARYEAKKARMNAVPGAAK